MGWETVVLDGGPADGLRIRVAGRAPVLQVVQPCPVEPDQPGRPEGEDDHPDTQVHALYVYRRTAGRPPRYRFDPASP